MTSTHVRTLHMPTQFAPPLHVRGLQHTSFAVHLTLHTTVLVLHLNHTRATLASYLRRKVLTDHRTRGTR